MNIKNVFFGVTIFGFGSVTGYFVCKKVLEKRFSEDIEEIKEFYYNKLEELGVQDEDFDPEMLNEENEEEYENEIMEETEEYLDKKSIFVRDVNEKGRPIINYNKPPLHRILEAIEDEFENESDEEEEGDLNDEESEEELESMTEDFIRRKHKNKNSGEPYVIDYDEFMEEMDEYEKQILYYYSVDRVLCEENDSIVDDESIVGLDYEDVLDMQTTAWVRNDTLNTMYAIYRIDESYSKSIEGLIETPRERDFRIKGRRKRVLDM